MSGVSPRVSRDRPVVDVARLSISAVSTEGAPITIVDDVTFSVGAGETLGIIGESGSGKSMTVHALAGLTPANVEVTSGSIQLLGEDVTALTPREWSPHRGRDVGVVFQDSINSLDPLFTVGSQLVEAIRAERRIDRREARRLSVQLLRQVGISAPEARLDAYPHELSGGMAQRVAIAIALCNQPALLIADEPTTALDVTMQRKILGLIRRVQRERDCAVVIVSHDLASIANIADRIAVMYAGRIIETGSVQDIIARPRHPYTAALLMSQPRLGAMRRERLRTIAGGVPPVGNWPDGCRFHPRCSVGADEEKCRTVLPPLTQTDQPHHESACFFWGKLAASPDLLAESSNPGVTTEVHQP
jgi:oligopeptide/dipeptide ABC transporter ATP-binding protein